MYVGSELLTRPPDVLDGPLEPPSDFIVVNPLNNYLAQLPLERSLIFSNFTINVQFWKIESHAQKEKEKMVQQARCNFITV